MLLKVLPNKLLSQPSYWSHKQKIFLLICLYKKTERNFLAAVLLLNLMILTI